MIRVLQINVGNGSASKGLMKQVAAEIKADAMVVMTPIGMKGRKSLGFQIRREEQRSRQQTGH